MPRSAAPHPPKLQRTRAQDPRLFILGHVARRHALAGVHPAARGGGVLVGGGAHVQHLDVVAQLLLQQASARGAWRASVEPVPRPGGVRAARAWLSAASSPPSPARPCRRTAARRRRLPWPPRGRPSLGVGEWAAGLARARGAPRSGCWSAGAPLAHAGKPRRRRGRWALAWDAPGPCLCAGSSVARSTGTAPYRYGATVTNSDSTRIIIGSAPCTTSARFHRGAAS